MVKQISFILYKIIFYIDKLFYFLIKRSILIWFKDFLGLGIDLVLPKQKYSLTPYYFWPKTEAWEQLKLELDSKLWLDEEEKAQILQVAGNVMNHWLLNRKTKTTQEFRKDFQEVETQTVFNK